MLTEIWSEDFSNLPKEASECVATEENQKGYKNSLCFSNFSKPD